MSQLKFDGLRDDLKNIKANEPPSENRGPNPFIGPIGVFLVMGAIVVVGTVHSKSSPKSSSAQTAAPIAEATPNSTPSAAPIVEASPSPAPTLAPVPAATPADEVIDENHPSQSDLDLSKKDGDIEKEFRKGWHDGFLWAKAPKNLKTVLESDEPVEKRCKKLYGNIENSPGVDRFSGFLSAIVYFRHLAEDDENATAGSKPEMSAWDGHNRKIDDYIRESMNDPDSYKFVGAFEPRLSHGVWEVKYRFRGKNEFGGVITKTVFVKMKDGEVVGIEGDD
jgi:hypothetical protein